MKPATALWITAPGAAELRPASVSDAPGYVALRARFSGISRGTESLVFQGRVPESEWERMRCPFQEGPFPAPVKYGYSLVGQVEDGPDRGRWAFVLHPHQDHCRLPPEALHLLPPDLPPRRAVLAANMETRHQRPVGWWRAGGRPGVRGGRWGRGAAGGLSLRAHCRHGRDLVDPDPARESVARALGLYWASPAAATGEADVVFHASGQPAGLVQALELAGFEARVVELSWYGDGLVNLPLGGAFHARRLQIRASQVGTVAGARRARWTAGRRLDLALTLLRDPVLDVLLEPNWSFTDAPCALARVCAAPGALCQVLSYD